MCLLDCTNQYSVTEIKNHSFLTEIVYLEKQENHSLNGLETKHLRLLRIVDNKTEKKGDV